jgi:hypothetical protein
VDLKFFCYSDSDPKNFSENSVLDTNSDPKSYILTQNLLDSGSHCFHTGTECVLEAVRKN